MAYSISSPTIEVWNVIRATYRLTWAIFWSITALLMVPLLYFISQKRNTWQLGFSEFFISFICRRFYLCFNVKAYYEGEPVTDGNLVVANHISWIDILLLNGRIPYGFVAKSEVRKWPIFGAIGASIGTLFIERENKLAVYRALPDGQNRLKQGQTLALFPEGTTSEGITALKFYPMLFEIASRQGCQVQPIAIRYATKTGDPSRAAAFIGDDGFVESLVRMAMSPVTYAYVHYLPPINANKLDRKALAKETHRSIQTLLANQTNELKSVETQIGEPYEQA